LKIDPKDEIKEGGGSYSGSLGIIEEEEVVEFFGEKKRGESEIIDDIVEVQTPEEEKEAQYFYNN
jgi:hypothetical protein